MLTLLLLILVVLLIAGFLGFGRRSV